MTLIVLAAALAVTALVYWPGLSGGYVFDDYPNIVDNAGVHVTQSTLVNWANAAWSSPASSLHRPLASLTFAANWFFSGADPGPMKAVNIGIHLLNGLLLYFMLRELLRAWNACPSSSGETKQEPSSRATPSGDPETANAVSSFRTPQSGDPEAVHVDPSFRTPQGDDPEAAHVDPSFPTPQGGDPEAAHIDPSFRTPQGGDPEAAHIDPSFRTPQSGDSETTQAGSSFRTPQSGDPEAAHVDPSFRTPQSGDPEAAQVDPSFRTPQSGDPESALASWKSRFRVRPYGPPRNDGDRSDRGMTGSAWREGFKIDETAAHRLALLVAACWLLLPINLMAVLYVVQRMESLCQVFVLAGLWGYLHGRRRMLTATDAAGERIGLVQATLGIILGTGIGLLSKESSVMLPVYALLVEWVLFDFGVNERHRRNEDQRDENEPRERGRGEGTNPAKYPDNAGPSPGIARHYDRRVIMLFVFVLLVPAALGLAWLLPGILKPAAWDGRSFTLGERLLTEARVLVKYLRWTLFPDPVSLSLYHDEMPLSTGLLKPWTTLPAIVFLAALLGLAAWLRKRRPLIALGILWFFAAQLLTATVIPLELVYEHRNYFASIGVLLAAFSIVLGLRRTIVLPIVRGTLVAVLLMWCAGVTYLRAQDWSDPLRLALSEANRHPDSPRANYEAGRLLIIASDYEPGELLDKSRFFLHRAGALPGSSALPEQALIMIDTHEGKADEVAVWDEMIAKLRNQPTTQEDISALISLSQCRRKNDCHFDIEPLQRAFQAGLSRPHPIARLYSGYADFAFYLLHDDALAIDAMRNAVKRSPSEPAYRVQLAHWLAIHGMTEEAVRQIDALRRMDSLGRLDAQIKTLEQEAERGGPPLAH